MTGISTAPTAGLLARLSAPAAIRIALLLYGLLLAGLSVQRLDELVPDQPALMGTRSEDMRMAIRTLETGGPPLLACTDGYDESRPLAGCHPAGVTDDQGAYLYLPLLARLADLDSPEEALKWSYIGLFGILALVSPLIFYGLFGSLAAALFAPAAIVFHFDLFANTDIYWISAWCYLLAIPLLLLVYERWGKYSPLLIAGVVVIGSFASSVRIHTGLPILLGALMVAVLRRRSLAGLLATAAVVCLAYLTFVAVFTASASTATTPSAIRASASVTPRGIPLGERLPRPRIPTQPVRDRMERRDRDRVRAAAQPVCGPPFRAVRADPARRVFRIAREYPGLVLATWSPSSASASRPPATATASCCCWHRWPCSSVRHGGGGAIF